MDRNTAYHIFMILDDRQLFDLYAIIFGFVVVDLLRADQIITILQHNSIFNIVSPFVAQEGPHG